MHGRLLAALLLLLQTAWADTTWVNGGNVSGLWSAGNSPYMIQGNVTVPSGSNLAIGPGVTVYFSGPCEFTVNGGFEALGTVTDSIRFTTDTTANPERWLGLAFDITPATRRLEYCVIEFAVDNGAITCWEGRLEMNHCVVRHNRTDYDGGGLSAVFMVPFILSDCRFEDNEADAGTGGNGSGGAIYSLSDSVLLTRCVFRNNRSGGSGGAIAAYEGPLSLVECTLEDNRSGQWGGGVLTTAWGNVFSRCILRGNSAIVGGGLHITALGWQPITIEQCVLDSNVAGIGGGIHATVALATVMSNTVVCRSQGRGVIWTQLQHLTPQYCLFHGNTPADFGANADGTGLGVLDTVNYNGDSADVYLNIFADPRFVDAAQGDYHLQENSPCVDAGGPIAEPDSDGTPAEIGVFRLFQALPIAPRVLSFPATGIADTSALWVRLRNVTPEPIALQSLAVVPAVFSASALPLDSVIAAGDTLELRVCFAPDSCADYAGQLTVTTALGARTCRLSGRGEGPLVTAGPPLLQFDAVPPGGADTLRVFFANLGMTLLEFDSLELHPPFYALDVPGPVPPQDTMFVLVTFAPAAEGNYQDLLRIHSNACNRPTPLVVTGTSVPDAAPDAPAALPRETALYAAYPNPFNATTVIPYDVAHAGHVSLRVFDVLGREVSVLADELRPAGRYRAVWNAEDLPSGIYFAILEASQTRAVQKIVLLK